MAMGGQPQAPTKGDSEGRHLPPFPATRHIPFRNKLRFSQSPGTHIKVGMGVKGTGHTVAPTQWAFYILGPHGPAILLRTKRGPLKTAYDLFFLPPASKPSEQREMKPENLFLHLHEGESLLPKN